MNIYKQLNQIQTELKAPKTQRNNFGKYNYRSTEDILEAVKPLLDKTETVVTIEDKIELIGDRYYIKATAILHNKEGEQVLSTAYAREPDSKKGMDLAQLTGATSSYARKYALNGLFAIDDTKDSDSTNKHEQEEEKVSEKQLGYLFHLAKELDYVEDMAGLIKEKYNKNNSKDLTSKEASDIINLLKQKVG